MQDILRLYLCCSMYSCSEPVSYDCWNWGECMWRGMKVVLSVVWQTHSGWCSWYECQTNHCGSWFSNIMVGIVHGNLAFSIFVCLFYLFFLPQVHHWVKWCMRMVCLYCVTYMWRDCSTVGFSDNFVAYNLDFVGEYVLAWLFLQNLSCCTKPFIDT